jgi:glycosylphosphatidylinositol transamidase (GPIT) subunit GPI8
MFSPRGGSGPKHSAFCGACFSINPYKSIFGTFSSKRGQKITNRRLFPSATKYRFLTIFNIYSSPSATLLSSFNLSLPNFSSISSSSVGMILIDHYPFPFSILNFLNRWHKINNILKTKLIIKYISLIPFL